MEQAFRVSRPFPRQVYANDLNPASTRYMAANVKLNHVAKRVHIFNMDGRAFVRLLCDAPPMPQQAAQLPAAAAAAEDAPQQQQQQQDGGGDGQAPQQQAGTARPGMILGPAGGASQPSAWNLPDVPPTPEGFQAPKGGLLFDHAVMNLPASAVEFLDAFNGAFDPATWRGRQLPLVHVYTFKMASTTQEGAPSIGKGGLFPSSGAARQWRRTSLHRRHLRCCDVSAEVLKRVEHYLGGPLEQEPTVHMVRDVSPNKAMLCITFRVPAAVAFNGRPGAPQEQQGDGSGAADEHHDSKRQRLDA